MLKTVHLFYPSFEKGGATKNLIRIVNFLLKKKIKVLFFSRGANKNDFIKNKNLKVINTKPLKKLIFLPIRWNLAISSMINLGFYIKKNNKNSIIFSMQSHIPAIIMAKINCVKIVIRNSEEPLGATLYADNKILGFFVLFLKIIFYNFASKIIAISTMSKNSLQKLVIFKKKVTLIYNPYLEKILKIKKTKKNKLKNFNILSIGRLTKQKNFPLLINAVIKNNGGTTIVKTIDLFSDYKNVADKVAAWKPKLSKLGVFGNRMLKQRNIDKWVNSGIQSTGLNGKIVRTKTLD